MKINVETTKPDFQPITLSFTIESEEELKRWMGVARNMRVTTWLLTGTNTLYEDLQPYCCALDTQAEYDTFYSLLK